MVDQYFEEETFTNADFTGDSLPEGEFEECTFLNCDFSNSSFSQRRFTSCEFTGCNLSLVKLLDTSLQEVKFQDCKMLGLQFGACHRFGFAVSFENCVLNHSSFYQVNLKRTLFRNCKLPEVDFTEGDLSNAVLESCDLARASFDHTILEKADFRTSYHYSIDPEINRIRKAKFSESGLAGLLDKYNIEISQ